MCPHQTELHSSLRNWRKWQRAAGTETAGAELTRHSCRHWMPSPTTAQVRPHLTTINTITPIPNPTPQFSSLSLRASTLTQGVLTVQEAPLISKGYPTSREHSSLSARYTHHLFNLHLKPKHRINNPLDSWYMVVGPLIVTREWRTMVASFYFELIQWTIGDISWKNPASSRRHNFLQRTPQVMPFLQSEGDWKRHNTHANLLSLPKLITLILAALLTSLLVQSLSQDSLNSGYCSPWFPVFQVLACYPVLFSYCFLFPTPQWSEFFSSLVSFLHSLLLLGSSGKGGI